MKNETVEKFHININKLKKIIIETLNSNFEDVGFEQRHPIEVVEIAEKRGRLYQFKHGVYFCSFNCIGNMLLMVFTMELPGTSKGSSKNSTTVMDIVKLMEKYLKLPIKFRYHNSINGDGSKNISSLVVIKHYNEDEMI